MIDQISHNQCRIYALFPYFQKVQDPFQEIVAELSAQALSRIVGKDGSKHLGKSYRYIESYAKEIKLSPHSAVLHVLSDVEKVLHLILRKEEQHDN